MKIKHILLFFILFFIGTSFVNAKSIEYNLTIDDDMNFKEDNIYKIKKSEMDNSGNYDFMTSVVKNPIYFDQDLGVKYSKTKKIVNGEYIVNLKHSYTSLFFTGSRILNECFSKLDFTDNDTNLSIKLSSPFYCNHRADSIKINIKTDLDVISSNADYVNNNIYTWIPKNDNFDINFKAQIPNVQTSDEPIDNDGESEQNENAETEQTKKQEEKKESKKTSPIVVLSIVLSVIVLGLIIAVILKAKNSNLNKI